MSIYHHHSEQNRQQQQQRQQIIRQPTWIRFFLLFIFQKKKCFRVKKKHKTNQPIGFFFSLCMETYGITYYDYDGVM